MGLPDYFGRNFDALDDCIADLPIPDNRGGSDGVDEI